VVIVAAAGKPPEPVALLATDIEVFIEDEHSYSSLHGLFYLPMTLPVVVLLDLVVPTG
jgi:hypothetical protein